MKGCPFTNPKVAAISKAHGKSVAQVCRKYTSNPLAVCQER